MSIDEPVKIFQTAASAGLLLGRSLLSLAAEFRNDKFHFIKKFLIHGAGITLIIIAAGRQRQMTHGQTAKPGVIIILDHFNTGGGANIGTGTAADADG